MPPPLRNALAGRYDVGRELGAGGMAVVYLARDLKHDREVAIKVLRPDVAASVGPERFLREIQVAAKLSHPHILPLYDSGEADGFLYYVMPYVVGESLEERLERERQLPVEEAVRIAAEVADALGHAHAHGLVHRDVKPGNVMLMGGHAVVADFGICRAIDVAGGERLTKAATSMGTPTYMAPEQWDEAREVDGRADIYSLGCTLYEMLVGQPPFTGTTLAAVMARHSMEAVPKPSIQRDAIHPYLESVILKALSKTPADRYASAEELTRDLERSSRVTMGLEASPLAAPGRGRRRLGRPVVAAAGVLALLGVGVWLAGNAELAGVFAGGSSPGAAIASGLGARAGTLPVRRIAVLYFDDVSSDGSLGHVADGLTEALIDELARVSSLDVVSSNGSLQFRGSSPAYDSVARALQAGTIVSGTVGTAGERLRVNLALADGQSGTEFRRGSFERPADDLFGIQSELAEEVSRLLREWLGEEVQVRSGRAETESVAAWALVQRAERATKQGEDALLEDDLEGFVAAFGAADSLLAEAEAVDPSWHQPPSVRGHLARRWAQLSAAEPLEAGEWIETGVAHVERALALDATSAAALETRGMLRYLSWALSLEPNAVAAADLLRGAESDLSAAVRYDPTRANAWSVLSIIHSQNQDPVDAKLTAQRAYEEDAYLRAADQLLLRLYSTSYDLGQFPDAVQYCAEGRRRFPNAAHFVECELWLMASPAGEPDVARAWQLLERFEELSPPPLRERNALRGRIIVGGVIAQAGLADSANAVLLSARSGPAVDPSRELLGLEAVFRLQMGEEEEALELVKTYLTASPEHRAGWQWTSHWWWGRLRSNAEFRQLVAG
jgi:serine/threonine-protein kinase